MKRFGIQCGVSQPSGAHAIAMDVHGAAKNVNLRIDYITRPMLGNVPDLLIDLLEVAAYVYCADQRLGRGSNKLTNFGENWRRCLHFSIPVRHLEAWHGSDINELLAETLGFLSDDSYAFEFRKADAPVQPKEFYFPDLIDASMEHDEVALFSGGVDSFAGAVEDIVTKGASVTLVGHYSSTKVRNVQENLIDRLKQHGFDRKVSYIPVWVTNTGVAAREFSQRTRSFLFACLGLVIARMSGKDRFSFYENGVVSINPPLAGDVIGGRATRTTHPKVLRGLEVLFSTLLDRSIQIRTPLQWLTKKEVTLKIHEAGLADMLAMTNSCKVSSTSKARFLVDFPEVVSALDSFPALTAAQAGDRLYDLFQRQAQAVEVVIADNVQKHACSLYHNELPAGSLLTVCFSRGHVEAVPPSDYDAQTKSFVDRISTPVLEFAINDNANHVLFRGGLVLKGANFRFVGALLGLFREAKSEDSEFPFLPPTILADRLQLDEQSMRQQLRRLRKELEPLAVTLGIPMDQDTFIETKERAGYRLNPSLRETAVADIKKDHPPPTRC